MCRVLLVPGTVAPRKISSNVNSNTSASRKSLTRNFMPITRPPKASSDIKIGTMNIDALNPLSPVNFARSSISGITLESLRPTRRLMGTSSSRTLPSVLMLSRVKTFFGSWRITLSRLAAWSPRPALPSSSKGSKCSTKKATKSWTQLHLPELSASDPLQPSPKPSNALCTVNSRGVPRKSVTRPSRKPTTSRLVMTTILAPLGNWLPIRRFTGLIRHPLNRLRLRLLRRKHKRINQRIQHLRAIKNPK
ncbi:MAG: hypothetical protein [Microviridae sp.]|nr:MAG: hypothetical protein [Microviridae sp.]